MEQVKKVLIYENRKSNPEVWDVSTPELTRKAFLELFNLLDESWQVYDELKDVQEPKKPSMTLEEIAKLPLGKIRKVADEEHREYQSDLKQYQDCIRQKSLYDKAKSEDSGAAHSLLRERKGYEYENWDIFNVNE